MKLKVKPWKIQPWTQEIIGVHMEEFQLSEEPALRFRVNMAKRHFAYTSQTRNNPQTNNINNFFSYEIWKVEGDQEEYLESCASGFGIPLDKEEALNKIRETYKKHLLI